MEKGRIERRHSLETKIKQNVESAWSENERERHELKTNLIFLSLSGKIRGPFEEKNLGEAC